MKSLDYKSGLSEMLRLVGAGAMGRSPITDVCTVYTGISTYLSSFFFRFL